MKDAKATFSISACSSIPDLNRFILTSLSKTGITYQLSTFSKDDPSLFSTISHFDMLMLPMTDAESDKLLLEDILHAFPENPVIIITSPDNLHLATECIKKGAYEFLFTPLDNTHFSRITKTCFDLQQLRQAGIATGATQQLESAGFQSPLSPIISQNNTMLSLFNYCHSIATSKQPVLITGETGVGKELFAQALHRLSKRRGNFIPVNIAGIDNTVFTDCLFGHLKGSFTGAISDRKGLIEEAAGGTLFLDEIGELSPESQLKLLRLLQEHEYLPLGSDTPKQSNARIIVATNKNLDRQINSKHFRSDLYFRLKTHHLAIPPLRRRPEDIPLLLNYFIRTISAELGKKAPSYPQELITLLNNYSFPGNVRELRAMVFDALSQHRTKMLSMKTFRNHLSHLLASRNDPQYQHKAAIFSALTTLPTLKSAANMLIIEAMKRAERNQKIAAQLLGISQQTLSYRLKSIDLNE